MHCGTNTKFIPRTTARVTGERPQPIELFSLSVELIEYIFSLVPGEISGLELKLVCKGFPLKSHLLFNDNSTTHLKENNRLPPTQVIEFITASVVGISKVSGHKAHVIGQLKALAAYISAIEGVSLLLVCNELKRINVPDHLVESVNEIKSNFKNYVDIFQNQFQDTIQTGTYLRKKFYS